MTPFALVREHVQAQDATKRELIGMTRKLERAAVLSRPPAVAASLQDARYLTDRTRAVYAELAEAGAHARLHARGLQAWLAPGVEGVDLSEDDPLAHEWVVVLPGNDPVVFAAVDLRTSGVADDERAFSYAVSRDPHVVASCGRLLGI